MSSEAEGSINDVEMDQDDVEDLDNDLDAILQDNEDTQESQENSTSGALIPEAEEVNDMAEENKNEDEEKKEVKPKRVIRNPQPKLNEQTIKGPRGIAVLDKYFERVKFKGKGHEEQDLNVIMKTYEYWCHRLFPKFPFDNCIHRLETLGKKKATQTYIKRIRYDLLLNEDEEKPIQSDQEDNLIDNTPNPDDLDDPFDQLTGALPPLEEPQLTEDQLERIKQNRERAERIRQEKLRQREENSALIEQNLPLPGTSRTSQDMDGSSMTNESAPSREYVEDQLLLEKVRERARKDVEESNFLPTSSGTSTTKRVEPQKNKENNPLRRIREKAALNVEKSNFLPTKKSSGILEDSESDESTSELSNSQSRVVRKNVVHDSDSESRDSNIAKNTEVKQLASGSESNERQVSSCQKGISRKNNFEDRESDSDSKSGGESTVMQRIQEKATEDAEKSNFLLNRSVLSSSDEKNLSRIESKPKSRIRKKKLSRMADKKRNSIEERDVLRRIENKAAKDLEKSSFLPLLSSDEDLSDKIIRNRVRKKNQLSDSSESDLETKESKENREKNKPKKWYNKAMDSDSESEQNLNSGNVKRISGEDKKSSYSVDVIPNGAVIEETSSGTKDLTLDVNEVRKVGIKKFHKSKNRAVLDSDEEMQGLYEEQLNLDSESVKSSSGKDKKTSSPNDKVIEEEKSSGTKDLTLNVNEVREVDIKKFNKSKKKMDSDEEIEGLYEEQLNLDSGSVKSSCRKNKKTSLLDVTPNDEMIEEEKTSGTEDLTLNMNGVGKAGIEKVNKSKKKSIAILESDEEMVSVYEEKTFGNDNDDIATNTVSNSKET